MKSPDTQMASIERTKIVFTEIEFFSADEITIIGEIEMNGKTEFAQYITTKKNLYLLLKHSGKQGRNIINLIVDSFARPHEVVLNLNFKEIYGKAVCLEGCTLKLDRSFYETEVGEWKVDYKTNLFFIDNVQPVKAHASNGSLF